MSSPKPISGQASYLRGVGSRKQPKFKRRGAGSARGPPGATAEATRPAPTASLT